MDQHHRHLQHRAMSASPSQEVGIFIPDLRGFLRQLERYWNVLALSSSSSSSPWARLPVYDDFQAFCLVALRAYLHANHGHTYVERGFATDSFAKIEATIEAIRVPLYVYDLIREISRPMILSDHEYLLPYLPFLTMRATRGQGPVPGLGFKSVRDPLVTAMLNNLLGGGGQLQQQQQQQQQMMMMPIVKEEPGLAKCPAFICKKYSLAVYGVHTLRDTQPLLPEWRLKACCILRHLQPSCPWYRSFQLRPAAAGGGGGGLVQTEGMHGKPARFYRADEKIVLQRSEEEYGENPGRQQQQRQQQQQAWGDSPDVMVESQSKSQDEAAMVAVTGEEEEEEEEGDEGGREEVEIAVKEPGEMPHLLKHLVDNLGGENLGYSVPLFSTQGTDMLAPFPCERSAAAAAAAAPPPPPAGGGGGGGGGGEHAAMTAASKVAGLFGLNK